MSEIIERKKQLRAELRRKRVEHAAALPPKSARWCSTGRPGRCSTSSDGRDGRPLPFGYRRGAFGALHPFFFEQGHPIALPA
jgi:hypothetical protein